MYWLLFNPHILSHVMLLEPMASLVKRSIQDSLVTMHGALIINTLFLQNWAFYEFTFSSGRTIPLQGKWPLSFQEGLSGPLRLGA